MTREEIIQQLKNIVKPYVREQEAFESLTESTDFINDLKIRIPRPGAQHHSPA